MIIVMGFYKRRSDLTWQEFSDHWRNVHGPLLRDTPKTAQYMRRYVQHHLRPSPGGPAFEFDGFSEGWFDSLEARQEMHESEEFLSIVRSDSALFLDLSATHYLVLDKPVHIVGDPPVVMGRTWEF